MRIPDSVYVWLRKRASFSHGGTAHHDPYINDLTVTHPYVADMLMQSNPPRYERKFQQLWLRLYNLLSKLA